MMPPILDVKNLRISFRTNNGTVKAVRDISFQLNKGETLAVVGESGSGKSVTARAVMGILAPNAIVDNGEIIYDGKDLLKLPESEFQLLRGDKLSMIFQDPLSSLNPIVRIGKQLTEAMILNNKERRKNAGVILKRMFRLLEESINQAQSDTPEAKKKTAEKIAAFREIVNESIVLETAYDAVSDYAYEAVGSIESLLIDMIGGSLKDNAAEARRIAKLAGQCYHDYFLPREKTELPNLLEKLNTEIEAYAQGADNQAIKELLTKVQSILKTAMAGTKPNFFCLGYYIKHNQLTGKNTDIHDLNALAQKYLDDHFMRGFLQDVSHGIRYSYSKSIERKKNALESLQSALRMLDADEYDEKQLRKIEAELVKQVYHCIDRLDIHKDNAEYIFGSSLHAAINKYFSGKRNNPKELQREAKQTAEYQRLIAAGKDASKVVPAILIDLDATKATMKKVVENVVASYTSKINAEATVDYEAMAIDLIDYLRLQASHCADKLTKQGAKHRALELMGEVGISEPRKRYNQFPFQFSGGMRQRIVIAIALSANPDILICDEPTTALDVTIQSQILELINQLKRERGLSIIFITHDLGVVANMADRIAVMYAGKVVEYGKSDDIFYEPSHPYTWALLSSMPDLDTKEKLFAIAGTPPNMIIPPKGDAFAARNQHALQIDFEQEPPFFKVSDTHYAATWLLHPNAPKVNPPSIVTERIARMKRLEEESHAQ